MYKRFLIEIKSIPKVYLSDGVDNADSKRSFTYKETKENGFKISTTVGQAVS